MTYYVFGGTLNYYTAYSTHPNSMIVLRPRPRLFLKAKDMKIFQGQGCKKISRPTETVTNHYKVKFTLQ